MNIIVMARAPIPGQCKTRLIPLLGEQGAAHFAHWCIDKTVSTALAAMKEQGVEHAQLHLFVAGEIAHPAFSQLLKTHRNITCTAQEGTDLGQRMQHAVQTVGSQHAGPVIVVGTDCPMLSPLHLLQVDQALRSGEQRVAITPSTDGGYVLIGFARADAALLRHCFERMQWSVDTVYAATMERLHKAGESPLVLPALTDVDEPQDYLACEAAGWCPPAAVWTYNTTNV